MEEMVVWVLAICFAVFVLIYLLLIMPRLGKRKEGVYFTKWLYAHRGLHDTALGVPENSMAAFGRAVEAGYGIELDIQLSKDKIPVVFHDFTLKRVCGAEGKVSDYTYEELRNFRLSGSEEKIPKLEEVLALVDGRVPLIVEFKIEFTDLSLCPIADKLLREYKGQYCMESFNPLGVLWYRRNHKEVIRGQLADHFHKEGEYRGLLYFLLQNLLFNFLTKPDFIAYNRKYPKKTSRRLCRGLYGNLGAAWTIRSREELAEAEKYFDIFIFEGFIPTENSGNNHTIKPK